MATTWTVARQRAEGFVVAGGHRPVLPGQADAALDGVALLVDLLVEGGCPHTVT